MQSTLSTGTVHTIPTDVRHALLSHTSARTAWQDITRLARNEWLCWIASAKKEETRQHRLKRMCTELTQGKRRPCCWAGCMHRE
jgi:uncharacterized protein YdeI (YjbR/CyaY-like superfamily)